MVDLYSGKTITTKADIWVIIFEVLVIIRSTILGHCTVVIRANYVQQRMIDQCIIVFIINKVE